MNRLLAISAIALLAVLGVQAQTNATPPAAPAVNQPAASQQTQAAPAQTTGTPAASSTGNHRVLQAKSQEELKAYQDAFAKSDPAQAEAAADDFSAKYPDSELRASLYMRVMNLFAQAN